VRLPEPERSSGYAQVGRRAGGSSAS
jgi:hypothetical protein